MWEGNQGVQCPGRQVTVGPGETGEEALPGEAPSSCWQESESRTER